MNPYHTARVHRYTIIGTAIERVEVYEPYDGHSTIMHFDGRRFGQIGTRPIPARIEAMVGGSADRIAACAEWHRQQDVEAAAIIEATSVPCKDCDAPADMACGMFPGHPWTHALRRVDAMVAARAGAA